MSRIKYGIILFLAFFYLSCSGTPEKTESGDLVIELQTGEEWLHEFNFFLSNPPQLVIWTESIGGEYRDTVFATRKIATEGWMMNGGNRRIESLPYWMHKRNQEDKSGILLPSGEEPLPDAVTGASPKKDVEIHIRSDGLTENIRVFLELNHSTDFNVHWPKDAERGSSSWSGGEWGSGQPSLVYSALIDLQEPGPWFFSLLGHGSPDGGDGGLYEDTGSLTTALKILDKAQIRLVP